MNVNKLHNILFIQKNSKNKIKCDSHKYEYELYFKNINIIHYICFFNN
jgi:hypothetical protein